MSDSGLPDVGLAYRAGIEYPEPPFHPAERYPELAGTAMSAGPVDDGNAVYGLVREALFRRLGGLDPRTSRADPSVFRRLGPLKRIVVKPNWVRQQEARGPCVTTHGSVLRPLIDYLLLGFGPDCEITVADVPLQSADLDRIWAETGIDALREHYTARSLPVSFQDWRKEKALLNPSGFIRERVPLAGDPSGYVEIRLGGDSFLEAITTPQAAFSVNDYEPDVGGCHHQNGAHGFLFPRSVLTADLVVNVAKLKTHCKAGITGCMKNLIGINGDKGWIPHFRAGAPADGGDEYPDGARHIMRLKSTVRNALQGHHPRAFSLAQSIWQRYRRGHETVSGARLLSGGAWPGNDTLWRSILDLVMAVTFAGVDGRLRSTPQRQHLCVVDAIVCGEGEGPLDPTGRPVGLVLCALDPLSVDWAASHVAGMDWRGIPQLQQATRLHSLHAGFPENPASLRMSGVVNGREIRSASELPVVPLVVAAGWERIATVPAAGLPR